jgi:hypothetical protein
MFSDRQDIAPLAVLFAPVKKPAAAGVLVTLRIKFCASRLTVSLLLLGRLLLLRRGQLPLRLRVCRSEAASFVHTSLNTTRPSCV